MPCLRKKDMINSVVFVRCQGYCRSFSILGFFIRQYPGLPLFVRNHVSHHVTRESSLLTSTPFSDTYTLPCRANPHSLNLHCQDRFTKTGQTPKTMTDSTRVKGSINEKTPNPPPQPPGLPRLGCWFFSHPPSPPPTPRHRRCTCMPSPSWDTG